eukprot:gene7384-13133_t
MTGEFHCKILYIKAVSLVRWSGGVMLRSFSNLLKVHIWKLQCSNADECKEMEGCITALNDPLDMNERWGEKAASHPIQALNHVASKHGF